VRAFLDANVSISYLLAPASPAPPAAVVRAGLRRQYTLLTSRSVLDEFRSRTATKPYLAARITPYEVGSLVHLLVDTAVVVSELPAPFPEIGRDRDDDYLIAHALHGKADYLVSGDADLVSLGEVESLRIVGPARFLAILRAEDRC
jgi:uncharacterized protein